MNEFEKWLLEKYGESYSRKYWLDQLSECEYDRIFNEWEEELNRRAK